MSLFKKGYEGLWMSIIRPNREIYDLGELGAAEFSIENRRFQRNDLSLYNTRNMKLVCSHFEPVSEERLEEKLPCVIFLHGNCSSRLEALTSLHTLLPLNITVFCFDMSGSGLSEGDYISLGWHERDDVSCVVDYLRGSEKVSCIGLWGRSMGAATSLLHGYRDPSIAAMVLDSPYSCMSLLLGEVAKEYTKVPNFLVAIAKSLLKKTIKKKADFNLFDLQPIRHVDQCFIPAMFIAATHDELIKPHHSQKLYEKYAGEKSLIMVDGHHNSDRPRYIMDSIGIFFYNTLQCENIGNNKINYDYEEEIINEEVKQESELESTTESVEKTSKSNRYEPKFTVEEEEKIKDENQRLLENLGYLHRT